MNYLDPIVYYTYTMLLFLLDYKIPIHITLFYVPPLT